MINKRKMGRTGLKLSELCLGTLNFGWKTDEKTSFAILDAYHAAGGNFIQSASHAPELLLPSASVNLSEEIVGHWWNARNLHRHDLFLSTRIHLRRFPDDEGSLVESVQQACQDSLRRLRTRYLDMVIFEWSDDLAPIRHWLEAFDHVIRSGLSRYIGTANFPVWRVVDALGRAYLRNHCRMEAIQSDYSLMTRARFEPEAMALCQEQLLAFFAQSPLAGGFLAQPAGISFSLNTSRREWLQERYGNSYGDAALSAIREVAERHQASTAQVGLAWVLRNPVVTSAIVGVHSVAQLNELLRASHLALTARDLQTLGEATVAEEVRVAPGIAHPRPEPGELVLT